MTAAEPPIDFAALQRLDVEAEALIREGRWTREEFERLWKAGLEAAGGDEKALDFLRYPAEPEWLPAVPGQRAGGGVYERVSRQVANLIHRLHRGWSPRLVLSRAKAVYWNNRLLPTARGDVVWEPGHARVKVTCGEDEGKSLMAEIKTYMAGKALHNTLRTEHAGGWCVESDNANIYSISTSDSASSAPRWAIGIHGSEWIAHKGHERPNLWLAPLSKPMEIRLWNLLLIRNPLYAPVPESRFLAGSSRGNWKLRGEYDYILVDIHDDQYFIVESPTRGELDRELLHRDIMTLRFIMGEAIQCPVFYGVHDNEVIACMGTGYYKGVPGVRAPAIADHFSSHAPSTEPFFSKLSRALRAETTAGLVVPVDASFESRYGSIDQEVRELMAAVLGFSHWTLCANEQAPTPAFEPRQRMEQALRKLDIPLPGATLDEITLYDARLRSWGSLTETIDRNDDEHEREVLLVETLRTVLVAMVAASVGYHGVIRGIRYNEGPPSWWHVDPEEAKGAHHYVAITAPTPAVIPTLAPGEILLIVEQRHHQTIVEEFLQAAALPTARVRVLVGDGRDGLRSLAYAAYAAGTSPVAVLAGSTHRSIPSALEALRKEFGLRENRTVLCAVPDVDAWLLADDELLRRHAEGDPDLLAELDAMSLPEEVPDPFAVAHRFLGPPESWSVLGDANIYRACVRSPSLRHFLSWMAGALGVTLDLPVESAERTISRDAIAGLVREMMPGDTVAWKTSNGHTYTADDISREVEQGSDVGHQYARDVLRVAIDFLQRQARRRRTA